MKIAKESADVNAITNLAPILEKLKAKNVFIVTGKNSFCLSGARGLISPYLKKKNVSYFDDFSPNPKLRDAVKGSKKLSESNSDVVIAIGGGSAIDMAKLININSGNDNFLQKDLKAKITKKGLPLIAIPTTVGSGSEATHFAVVYSDNIKYSIAHEYITPDYSIIDFSLTRDLPPKLIAVSGFDALSHAVESYWSINSTEKSKRYSSEAITLILSSLGEAVNSRSFSAINKMAVAANISGKAINVTKTTAPHAISYSLTIDFNIPHGHAVALLLGHFFVINSDLDRFLINDHRGVEYVSQTMRELFELFGSDSGFECMKKWNSLMSEAGLENRLEKFSFYNSRDIDKIVKSINLDRLKNNPVTIDNSSIKEIIFH